MNQVRHPLDSKAYKAPGVTLKKGRSSPHVKFWSILGFNLDRASVHCSDQPDDGRRRAAISALDKFPNGKIREFISYPPDVESITRMLKKGFDVVIFDLDSNPEYTIG